MPAAAIAAGAMLLSGLLQAQANKAMKAREIAQQEQAEAYKSAQQTSENYQLGSQRTLQGLMDAYRSSLARPTINL